MRVSYVSNHRFNKSSQTDEIQIELKDGVIIEVKDGFISFFAEGDDPDTAEPLNAYEIEPMYSLEDA